MCEKKPVHVLVLAMSDLRNPVSKDTNNGQSLSTNIFQYIYDREKESNIYQGIGTISINGKSETYKGMIGQLEPVPVMIKRFYKEEITHFLILSTEKTKNELKEYDWNKIDELCNQNPDWHAVDYKSNGPLSAVDFFKKRMVALGVANNSNKPEYVSIDIDENKPEDGLKELLDKIRELYKECVEENGDWRLWLDTHGGFRDIAMAMSTLVQVLSVTDMDGEILLKDGQKMIEISGIYSIHFSEDKSQPNSIINQTRFYKLFTDDIFKKYMNYGQYFQMSLMPYEGDEGYAFVSYKHHVYEKTFCSILGVLKKGNYRYWYDDGIHIGDNWQNTLDNKLKNCKMCIICLTKDYMKSGPCAAEMRKALELKKPIVFVLMEDIEKYLNIDEDNTKLVISKDEINSLFHLQHIVMEKYFENINGSFQEENLLRTLAASDLFSEIRGEFGG